MSGARRQGGNASGRSFVLGERMANSDAHLTGGIMALIVMALMFDDDEHGPAPASSDEELDQGPEEDGEPEPL